MRESVERHPSFTVRDTEYFRLLGYPRGHVPSDRALELVAWARSWYRANGRPWTYTRRVELVAASDTLLIDGLHFDSAQLLAHLKRHGAEAAMLVAVSAGRECEEHARQLWNEGKPDEYFFLEIFGSAVVEELVATTNGRVCTLEGCDDLIAVPHYSPGYSGWEVADQNKLFGLITRGMTESFPGSIEVLSSGMLKPKKSMLAVFGLAARRGAPDVTGLHTPCESCSFSPCQYRRAAYRHESGARIATAEAHPGAAPAGYTVNTRALRKWADERVQFGARADGTLEAVFRFDGTTCSNMGHPLAFDYRVILSGPDGGHRILETSCGPAQGDRGYEFTCAFLDDPDKHLLDIASDRPLIGQPLDDVLRWQRPSAPSGCHCTADTRIHKWGLALEAIHFALGIRRGIRRSGQGEHAVASNDQPAGGVHSRRIP
ncbi:MAG TPA: hypothetical protein VMM36_12460 [Opitutaceae bacterium]|nr:hypothetical protein [Opitutaceae bacterium]